MTGIKLDTKRLLGFVEMTETHAAEKGSNRLGGAKVGDKVDGIAKLSGGKVGDKPPVNIAKLSGAKVGTKPD